MRRHGAKYGAGDAAAKIVRDPATGRYEVPGGEDRSPILALRKDSKLAAAMAGELSKTNRASLQRALGREPTYQEVYAAHFLGANGAAPASPRGPISGATVTEGIATKRGVTAILSAQPTAQLAANEG